MRKRLTEKEMIEIDKACERYILNLAITGGSIGCGANQVFQEEVRRLFKMILIFNILYKEELAKTDSSVLEKYAKQTMEEFMYNVGG